MQQLSPFLNIAMNLLYQRQIDPLTSFYNLLEKASEILTEAGGGLIFIDELQNFLDLLGQWNPWGLFKFFTNIQEYNSNGYVKFILISSDFSLRKRVLEKVPGEYIATFYLGEVTRDDTLSLFRYCMRGTRYRS